MNCKDVRINRHKTKMSLQLAAFIDALIVLYSLLFGSMLLPTKQVALVAVAEVLASSGY